MKKKLKETEVRNYELPYTQGMAKVAYRGDLDKKYHATCTSCGYSKPHESIQEAKVDSQDHHNNKHRL